VTAAEVGRLLGDRYRLTERIAGGGMGEVWRAEDTVLGRDVAVKVLRREYADDPTFLARFRNEARHTAGLSHAGIAAVYDFGEGSPEEGGPPYLVMEYVPGEPLSALLSREGSLPAEHTLDILGQTALGLQAAHEAGVIHRDVKPGNILVTPTGTVKVTDFGIARAANAVPLTQTGAIMGTAFYISPEQASGRPVTPASDIYSLGIVAYECLTGQRPFEGDTPVSVALAQVSQEPPALPDDVPPPVHDLVMRMLAKDPAQRPSSAGTLGAEALALGRSLAAAAVPAGADATRVFAPSELPDVAPAGGETTTVVTPRSDPDTNPGFRLPDPSQVPHWLPYAAALLVALLLVLLVARACTSDPTHARTPRSGATSTGSARPSTLDIVRRDYLGRPQQDVVTELTGLGLKVQPVLSEGGGVVGTVKDVSPTGSVPAGTIVTVTVVSAPQPRGPGKQGPPGHDKGHEKKGG
jgi:serine/threonine-protein kinase